MKCCTIFALVVVLAHPSAASAQLETLIVSTDGSSANSTTILTAGVPYELRASGTFDIGGPGDGLADAEYADFSDPPSSIVDIAGNGAVDLGILIDGNKPRWGLFEPTHIYSLSFAGTGSTLAASYNDSFFDDNIGTLTLEIFVIPEPSSVIVLSTAGCLAGVVRRRRTIAL